MPYVANVAQYYSHDETLVREDLHDIITIMDPTDMPLFSTLEHIPVTQRVHQSPIDELDYDATLATAITTTVPEGKDAFDQAGTFIDPQSGYPDEFAIRLNSQNQINFRALDVANTNRATTIAGVEDPFLYQLYKQMLSLGKYAELQAHWGIVANVPVAGTTQQTDATARQTDGLMTWLARSGVMRNYPTLPAVDTVDGVAGSAALHPLGTIMTNSFFSNFYEANSVNLSRNMLHDKIMRPAHIRGMTIDGALVLVGSQLKHIIGDFSLTPQGPLNERVINANLAMLVDTIDVIRTDFGYIYVNMDRYMDLPVDQTVTLVGYGIPATGSDPTANFVFNTNDTLAMIDTSHWKIGVLRGFGYQPLAPIGDSTKGLIVGEWSIISRNPLGGTGGTSLLSA